ncbi:hypothetical protein [Streptomyces cavernae]|uniref:hypothetical protein n=1 Tax=Streptomyces cavernae TaxID=2259034 RepID=UPI000FEBAE25|nr:hypothetical protein [Streptomyces cavernae]
MPRPTVAQLAYGSCTVILATLAMLLLSQTSSTLGIAVVAVSGLALGLLVALTVPSPRRATAVRTGAGSVAAQQLPLRRPTVSAGSAPASASASTAPEPLRESA